MAEKKTVIVIKKITQSAEGHHGGSWKVAFADFMTAMMAFFLVMWLLGQSDEVKENVSEYFSTPSIIEHSFSNFGVELTLEKLFLDLVNEPLNFFQQFITPVDKTPNIMAMGTKKIVMHHIADLLSDIADNVEVNKDGVFFEISESHLFKVGTAIPTKEFSSIMKNIRDLTTGLENSNVYIDHLMFKQGVRSNKLSDAKNVAEKRLSIVVYPIEKSLEHETTSVYKKSLISDWDPLKSKKKAPEGSFRFRIEQKETSKDRKPRELKEVFSSSDKKDVYSNFVDRVSKTKRQRDGEDIENQQ